MMQEERQIAYRELNRLGLACSVENPSGIIIYDLDVPSAVYVADDCEGGVYNAAKLLELLTTCFDAEDFWRHIQSALILLRDA